jgi:protein TonB
VPRGDRCRPPEYPVAARRLGLQGRVVLRVHVGVDGAALSVEVEESSGHAVLDEAAVAAVRGWTFEPAREGECPVESFVSVPIRFRLRT